MTTTLITACEGIPSETDVVVISPNAVPHLLAAGWIQGTEAPTATVHRMLAHTAPPVLPDMGDER